MSSAGTKGAISGAASGAASGAVFGAPGVIIGGVLGGIGGLISGNSAHSQQQNANAWADYNRRMQYNTDVYNINAGFAIAGINAAAIRNAASANATAIMQVATYNTAIIEMTTEYNEDLLDNEMVRVWQDLDLDITQIEMFRARERADIVVAQSASGATVGEGGYADVIIEQRTQEALDASVVTFGADRQAADISNQIAQGRWQGEVAMQQTMWEGEMSAYTTLYNAEMQARSGVASATIQADAQMYSAKQAFMAGGNNINQANAQFNNQQTQAMVSGLYQAAGSYAGYKYSTRVVGPTTKTLSNGATVTGYRGSSSGAGQSISPYIAKPSGGSVAGTSLATGGK